MSVRLKSGIPLKSIYSPSHKVGVSRKGDHEAVIGFEEDKALLDRDFVLYYAVSKKEFGLNLLTHAVKGEPGFFMMMLAPSLASPDAVMAKDMTFVLDTSGSMAGGKLEQTRKALEYAVKTLHAGDRFNVIRFSTDIEPFSPKLVEVNAANREAALAFIRSTEARGGTAINDALAAALAQNYDSKRPAIILFLTDGRPTIGETTPETILDNVRKNNPTHARLFVFGVGEDVNTHLLDKAAGQNGGIPQYVTPNEDIEIKVSSLADKMSNPVLSNVRVEVDKMKTAKIHPSALPDLFSGEQITIFGRYDGSGDSVIRLTGDVNGKRQEFVYEGTFPAVQSDNTFISSLWATRRVGFLLDEIRLRGENAELKDEVIHLSRDFGIMTPYTSFLVLEDDKAYAQHGIGRMGSGGGKPAAKSDGFLDSPVTESSTRMVPVFAADSLYAARMPANEPGDRVITRSERGAALNGGWKIGGGIDADTSSMGEESGSRAVKMSKRIQAYKGLETAASEMTTVKHVGRKVFTLVEGRWIDTAFKSTLKITTVTFGSEEYFKLLKDKPDLKDVLALGTKVTVVLEDGTALVVE